MLLAGLGAELILMGIPYVFLRYSICGCRYFGIFNPDQERFLILQNCIN